MCDLRHGLKVEMKRDGNLGHCSGVLPDYGEQLHRRQPQPSGELITSTVRLHSGVPPPHGHRADLGELNRFRIRIRYSQCKCRPAEGNTVVCLSENPMFTVAWPATRSFQIATRWGGVAGFVPSLDVGPLVELLPGKYPARPLV